MKLFRELVKEAPTFGRSRRAGKSFSNSSTPGSVMGW